MQVRISAQNLKELLEIQEASPLKPSIAKLVNMIVAERAGNLRIHNTPPMSKKGKFTTNFK